ncbi:MAG: ABC transporter permease, partial [Bacteroidales bacterium]|nr:ABC transporter permease [Bacteroidales bacterium]
AMLFRHWLILFSTACFGNILGLNISAGMRTAVSIYILIPLLLVPQLLLGGAMIKFDDLHKSLSKKIYVPVIGDVMTTRWAFEAICVEQFKNNRFERHFFEYDMGRSQADWFTAFLLPTLRVKVDQCVAAGKNPEYREHSEINFTKLNYHISDLSELSGIKPGKWINSLNYSDFNEIIGDEAKLYLNELSTYFRNKSREISDTRDALIAQKEAEMGKEGFLRLREKDYNEKLADYVLNRLATNKIYDSDNINRLIQKADPIFMPPGSRYGRAHFFAPYKLVGNIKISTMIFNVIAIWIMTLFLFVTLYYNILNRFILYLEKLKLPIWRKFGRELLRI